ncbi:hypothetical protein P167DRAFT_579301 [Morchella conica CCBAS932]|uniref:Uncharacterized protein n=1 Tax=Morchella conica CCBAS932 TaxID=1392247 RepID=A0A3N4KA28_9PEZI|nr:hypothetical protein P167DRAFT_579301 [Morchella conica CCBAS932]
MDHTHAYRTQDNNYMAMEDEPLQSPSGSMDIVQEQHHWLRNLNSTTHQVANRLSNENTHIQIQNQLKESIKTNFRQQKEITPLTKDLSRNRRRIRKLKHHRAHEFRQLKETLHMSLVSVYRLNKQNKMYCRILYRATQGTGLGETFVDECHMPISSTESDGSEEDALGWNPSSSEEDTDDDSDIDSSYVSEYSDESVEGAEETI